MSEPAIMYESDCCVGDVRFQYVLDEKIIFSTLGFDMRWPLRVFNLRGLGIDHDAFLTDLAPTFPDLSWDEYDVRREQIHFLLDGFPHESNRLASFFHDYYAGETSLEKVSDLIERLTPEKKKQFEKIKPYRRRAIARFRIEKRAQDVWHIVRIPAGSFSQSAGKNDYRSVERRFKEMDLQVTCHPEFAKLIIRLAQVVEKIHGRPEKLEINAHQVGIVARHGKFGDNSPEGIHQDGTHYIVSALVVERTHVRDGESHVYGDDKQTEYLRFTLKPGQGIFQTDIESPFWHVVSPIYLDPSGYEIGYRNIFGFDIKVL
ncbi:MAG: 2OG-Fe dioxygenase family protein [Candidatus Sungbacteria bacterium]|nr:2OG-Fe dioxygenase family protein [Candidatus Sungbacteria bacterium]